MPIGDIDKLLDYLRLDKTKLNLQKLEVVYGDNGIRLVELIYYDVHNTLQKCVIGINGAKINELATG